MPKKLTASSELLEHIRNKKIEAGRCTDASYDMGHEDTSTFWRGCKFALESLMKDIGEET